MRFTLYLTLVGCAAASRVSSGAQAQGVSSATQGLLSRQQERLSAEDVLNRSVTSLDQSTQKKSKKEKVPCNEAVSGSGPRKRTHLFGGDCKCPPEHVVAGKSWDCGDALGNRKFSSKIGRSSCFCAPVSDCDGMVQGATRRNSYKKNPARPCKCENKDFVLEGKAPECAVFLGERYFPNTLPPQECYCHEANLKQYACSEIATGAVDTDKENGKCICSEGTFIGGEDQQCKDFYGAHLFPKRLKPGLCTCTANALRPGMGASSRVGFATPVLGVLLLWIM